jgi:hypothetical protein
LRVKLDHKRKREIMKNRLLLIIGLVAIIAASACNSSNGPSENIIGSGNVVTENRQVSGFHGIAVSGVGDVIVERIGNESLTITSDDNILPYLESDVRSGILFLGAENNVSVSPTRGIVYRLTASMFDEISVSGVVAVTADGIDTELLVTNMSGTCTVETEGKADSQDIATSGTSIFNGENLESRTVNISVSGTSHIVVRVSDLLQGQASGSAVVEYIGNPTVDVSVSGSAVVRPR